MFPFSPLAAASPLPLPAPTAWTRFLSEVMPALEVQLFPAALAWTAEDWRAWGASGPSARRRIWVSGALDAPEGFVVVAVRADRMAEVISVGVLPAARGRGVARALLDTVNVWRRAENLGWYFDVAPSNAPMHAVAARFVAEGHLEAPVAGPWVPWSAPTTPVQMQRYAQRPKGSGRPRRPVTR
jgi:GNAT superfamily N-acetyltransferase